MTYFFFTCPSHNRAFTVEGWTPDGPPPPHRAEQDCAVCGKVHCVDLELHLVDGQPATVDLLTQT